MALIFSFSSLQEPRFAQTAVVDLVVKKAGHFCLYLVLAFGFAFAFTCSLDGTRLVPRSVLMAGGLAILFAASDELHQVFTPTRDPSLIDVGIDSLGALTGVLAWSLVVRAWRGRR